MVTALLITIVVAGLATSMLVVSRSASNATVRDSLETTLLYVAETGLQYNFVNMEADAMHAVRDSAGYTWDATSQSYVGATQSLQDQDGLTRNFQLALQYRNNSTAVQFGDRTNPVETWDEVRVECTASAGGASRTAVAWYGLELDEVLDSVIISSMMPTGTTEANGFSQAQTGDIVIADGAGAAPPPPPPPPPPAWSGSGDDAADLRYFVPAVPSTDGQFVFGDIACNGVVRFYSSPTGYVGELTDGNWSSYVGGLVDDLESRMAGTSDQLPDFTTPGSSDVLLDVDRFEAAAAAGAGQVFTSLADFASAMNTANGSGDALEGIIVLDLDPATEGANPRLVTAAAPPPPPPPPPPTPPAWSGGSSDDAGDIGYLTPAVPFTDHVIAGGINISGALVIRFAAGTDPAYTVEIETALNINAADMLGFDASDPTTYGSGYPATYADAGKNPSSVDISPTYANFGANEDLPALVIENAVVDILGPVNVCGLVYTQNIFSMRNEDANVQYVMGSIIAGGGCYLEGEAPVVTPPPPPPPTPSSGSSDDAGAFTPLATGAQALQFDEGVLDRIVTIDNHGKVLIRRGFAIQ